MPRTFLLLVAMLLVGAACGQGDDVTATPALPRELDGLPVVDVHGDDFQQHVTAAELVAASDAVVAGTIMNVADGRFNAAPELEDFGGDRNLLITLSVDTVIAGSGLAPDDTVTIEWSGVAP